ncbi:MAG: glycosyltransferase [Bacteroidota bacterium]
MSKILMIKIERNETEYHDGVYLCQKELENALSKIKSLTICYHTLHDLFYNHELFKNLGKDDTILCNLDPLAYLYFQIREQVAGNFRIIRSVLTGPWNGYLLQESLCNPLTRNNDIILHISNFTKISFNSWFSTYLTNGQHVVCYPALLGYPKVINKKNMPNRKYLVGYIGRLSKDKGFDVVLECFKLISKKIKNAKFVIAGQPNTCDYNGLNFSDYLKKELNGLNVNYLGILNLDEVFQTLCDCQWILFPSTSNVESLGRILLEAQACETNILATNHAAAHEILPHHSLIKPNYKKNFQAYTDAIYPLGEPNACDFVERILNEDFFHSEIGLQSRKSDFNLLLKILNNIDYQSDVVKEEGKPQTYQIEFDGLPEFEHEEACFLSQKAFNYLHLLYQKSNSANVVLSRLKDRTMNYTRTEYFIKNYTKDGLDLNDIGGAAMEICHLLNFKPKAKLISYY